MKHNDAEEFNNWVVSLRDGSLEIQREFRFEAQATVETFMKRIGHFMKSPSLTVTSHQLSISPATVLIRITLYPEAALLEAAGEIAKMCESEFASVGEVVHEIAA